MAHISKQGLDVERPLERYRLVRPSADVGRQSGIECLEIKETHREVDLAEFGLEFGTYECAVVHHTFPHLLLEGIKPRITCGNQPYVFYSGLLESIEKLSASSG
jgi:hypothetical protein